MADISVYVVVNLTINDTKIYLPIILFTSIAYNSVKTAIN